MSNADPRNGSICILPHPRGLGGPASFAARLSAAMQARGWAVVDDPLQPGVRALLVMGGTRRLDLIWRARRKGVRIVQRLNGMNWVHRKLPTGLRHYLKAESANWILSTIRRRLADHVIYQSRFTQDWWQTVYGPVPARRGTFRAAGQVIYNGVDLQAFTPAGPEQPPGDCLRILMVEAHLGGGMEPGLENAVGLLQQLNQDMQLPVLPVQKRRWELLVAGDVPQEIRARWQSRAGEALQFAGIIPRDQVPALDRAAHMLFSADLNAACPNSVVEALACGLPVIAFATGALPEMVTPACGRIVPYGSNFWNLDAPVIQPMAAAARELAADLPGFRAAARSRAEEMFNIENVVESYLKVLLND